MKKNFKRALSCLLAVIMCICAVPMGDIGIKASAASSNWSWPTTTTKVSASWPKYSNGSYHSGIDFPVSVGTPVYSTCDGEVVAVTSLTTSYGKHIKIRAMVNGQTVYMRYCHLSSFAVQVGNKVSSGQLIAYSGNTGNVTGPHLHYEVRNANDYYGNVNSPTLNPSNYLPGTSYTYETNAPSSNFQTCIDQGISEGQVFNANDKMLLRGWAFNTDGSETSVIYCFDDAQTYTFNKVNREDVVAALGSKQLNCGFNQEISLAGLSSGTHKLSIWCESSSGGKDMFVAHFVYNADTEKPVIDNVIVKNSRDGYVVSCNISDNVGVTRVRFPSWSENNEQDDLIWHEGDINHEYGVAYCWVGKDVHNNESGNYYTHIYAYDAQGNEKQYAIPYPIFVGELIEFWGFSKPNNDSLGIDKNSTPTLSGDVKLWFKEYDLDTNYYINIFVDDKQVISHGSSDDSGYISYTINTANLSNGSHSIKAILADTGTSYTTIKNFNVNNPQYSLTFNANGGSCSTKNKTITKGSTYGTLPTPTRTGYTFDGWYTSATGGTKITASTKVTATGNHTLYAHWSHTHSYTSSITKAATCTQTGIKTFKCSTCGNTYTETIPATGHKEVIDKAIAATCKSEGKTQGSHCSVCRYVIKAQTIIKKADHAYTSTVKDQTCTENGAKIYTCSVCGDTYSEPIPATGHKEVIDKAIAATCKSEGKTQGSHCSVCGYVIKAQTVIKKTPHTYTSTVKDPTCTENGAKIYTCSVCGGTYSEAIPAIGHIDDDNDGMCDLCNKDLGGGVTDCTHICHKGGFAGFIYKIILVFWKLFKINQTCSCGKKHY